MKSDAPVEFCFYAAPALVINLSVRRIVWAFLGLCLCGRLVAADTDMTYQLTDGKSVTGAVISYNDNGIVFRLDVDKYSERVPWTKFSQEALKQLTTNPKIKPLAEPFIETPPPVRAKKADVKPHAVTRLDLPPKKSLFEALFSSSVGMVALLLIYAANIYAGYEIAVCRSRSILLGTGMAVVFPILGPIIFLAMPVRVEALEPSAAHTEAATQTFAVPGGAAAPVASGIHIVEGSWQSGAPAAGPAGPQVFQRGQFTFNRRFFETKFSGFFSMIRRDSEKNLVLVVKTGRQQFIVERITRIANNDMHVEVAHGPAKQEVMVAFADITEVQLNPKSA